MPDLTTVAEVQQWLGIAGETELIDSLVRAAESWIATYTGRATSDGSSPFLSASRTQRARARLDRHGSIVLRWTPITGVSSVTIATSASAGGAIPLDAFECDGAPVTSSGMMATAGILRWRGATHARTLWEHGLDGMCAGSDITIAVQYTGGWTADTLPADLRAAATRIAAQMYRERVINYALQSESLGAYSYTVAGTTTSGTVLAMRAGVTDMLEPYRRYVRTDGT